jgi:hypothetical protein
MTHIKSVITIVAWLQEFKKPSKADYFPPNEVQSNIRPLLANACVYCTLISVHQAEDVV